MDTKEIKLIYITYHNIAAWKKFYEHRRESQQMGLMLMTKSEGRILASRKRTAIRKHRQVDSTSSHR